jgi:hypothetical protein
LKQLFALTVVVSALLVPFDFLGGFWLPRKFGKCRASLFTWLRTYLAAAAIQGFFFIGFGLLILSMGQAYGIFGAITAVLLGVGTGAWLRNFQISCRRGETSESNRKLVDALTLIQSWQVFVPRTIVVRHHDPGFTGGIIGLGKRLKIVIPQAWLRFSTEQLATLIARRAVAVETGSYRKGVIAAVLWNVIGFAVCSLLPGANLTSVAGLVATICWFTLWSFLGLLTLPTVSRNASLQIDQSLATRGVPADWLMSSAFAIDQLQDGEPERPAFIETIFHPIPSVSRRDGKQNGGGLAAWNVARTTLFFSWACLGFLSRAVHCNVGRPELWTMLPSD